MKTFNGTELAFSHTYYPSRSDRVIEIPSDALVYPLTLNEVPETAGSYSFTDTGLGLDDRVLFWRTEGSKLHLNEICASRDVNESSLTIDVRPAAVISGTSITLHRDTLVIVIPTATTLHRLSIKICDDFNKLGNKSVLSCIPHNEYLGSVYNCYTFPNAATARKVSVECNYRGDTVCVMSNTKSQLAVVTMPFFYAPPTSSGAAEVVLREGSFINRLFIKAADPALAINMAKFDSHLYVFSVQSDGRLRCWLASTGDSKGSYSIADALRGDSAFDVEDVMMKSLEFGSYNLLVVKVQLVKKARFLFINFNDGDFKLLTSCDINSNAIADFICMSNDIDPERLTAWTITRESYTTGGTSRNSMFQPYLMHRTEIKLNDVNGSRWYTIDPAMPDTVNDRMLFESQTADTIKQRLFDGDSYSFETVQRAIQAVCKCAQLTVPYRDWHVLEQYVEMHLISGAIRQQKLTDDDQNADSSFNNSAIDRFWVSMQNCANTFQEASLAPIAMWSSPRLGLVGTIQQSRFTVYVKSDARMRALLDIDKVAISQLFDLVHKCVAADYTAEEVKNESLLLSVDTDMICRLIRMFIQRNPDEQQKQLGRLNSVYLNSSFSTALLASALRYRIMDRLCFGKSMIVFTKRLHDAFTNSKEKVDKRMSLVMGQYRATLAATSKHYETLWQTLSSTTVRYTTTTSRTSISQITTIAQTFFQSAHVAVNDNAAFVDEQTDRQMDDEDEQPQNQSRERVVRTRDTLTFDEFIAHTLDGAMEALWPESANMLVPRFLAESQNFEALQDYCDRNEPFVSQLAAAFRFFQGVALVGVGEPDHAAAAFEDATSGVVNGNETLNHVLGFWTKHVSPYRHSLADYYVVVMNVFRQQAQAEFVIRSGMFALKFASENDSQLPIIYTALFSQYMAIGQYVEAIRMLHLNPSGSEKEACVRSLVTSLWDYGKASVLITLHYGELTDQIVELLEIKCKALHPMSDAGFFETVYAFHMHRYNYEAARVMYCLSWRLRWEAQSADVLARRLQILSAVCQTVELLPADYTMSFDIHGNVPMDDDNEGAEPQEVQLQNICMSELYNEYLLLEARLALIETAGFPNGPPVVTQDVYNEMIPRRFYDLAFVLQRHFHLDSAPLIYSLALDCIDLGDHDSTEAPEWVQTNRRFVDCVVSEEDVTASHWKLLITYIDLSIKHTPADIRVLRPVLLLLLERSMSVPTWLETRYVKANCREFLHHLIEFDELPYAFKVLNEHLESVLSRKGAAAPRDIHSLPITQSDCLLKLSAETHADYHNLDKAANKTRDLLKKVFRSIRPQISLVH